MALKLISTLDGHEKEVWSVTWSHSGKYLASCSSDKSVKIWILLDAESKNEEKSTKSTELKLYQTLTHHKRTTRNCSFKQDDSLLAICSFDGNISVFQYQKQKSVYIHVDELDGHNKEVKGVCWHPSKDHHNLLASCARDRTVWVWEYVPISTSKSPPSKKTGEYECICILREHFQDVKYVRFHPSRKELFSCSFDGSIRIWTPPKTENPNDDDEWECKQSLEDHDATIWNVDFDASGRYMCSVSTDMKLIIWKVSEKNGSWKNVCEIKSAAKRTIYSCSWSKVNDLIAICSEDNTIRIFARVEKEKEIWKQVSCVYNAHKYDINGVCWHPWKNILASCGDDLMVKIWKWIDTDHMFSNVPPLFQNDVKFTF